MTNWRLRTAAGVVAAVAVGCPIAILVTAPAASADSCKVMSVSYALTSGNVIALDPPHYDIAYGGCVQFFNRTASMVTVTVSPSYSRTLGPGESTAGTANYRGTTPGRQKVTAKSGPSSASGSITVGAAPSPSRSPSSRPPAHHPSSHPPAPQPTSSGTGPQVAPTPSPPRVGGFLPKPKPPAPPSVVPPLPSEAPSVPARPEPSATAVVAGPLEHDGTRRLGLPAALAALAAVGVGAGLVRVVLSEPISPVDGAETVAGPA